jgi:hypothetical protein
MAGVTYDFNTFVPQGATGTWIARFGSIDSNGNYIAPSYMPPGAEDRITYHDTSGKFLVMSVHIRANPHIVDSSFPRYLKKVEETNTEYQDGAFKLIGGANQAVLMQGDLEDFVGQFPGEMPYLEAGDLYELPEEVTDCVELSEKTANSKEFVLVEEDMEMGTSEQLDRTSIRRLGSESTVLVSGTRQKVNKNPMRCKYGRKPKHGWPAGFSKDCTGAGTHIVAGPVKRMKRVIMPPVMGQFEFTSAVEAKVPNRFLPLQGNYSLGQSYPVARTYVLHTHTRENDVYRCEDGKWVYKGRQICEKTGQGIMYAPKWFYAIDGYPQDGAPGVMTEWDCQMRGPQ